MNYENTIPLYIQISNDMMSKIENNVYKGMLPSEKEFVNIYQVSRVTIRKALDKQEELEAIIPTKEMRELLNLDKDGAVLKRIRKGYSESGVLLEYTINYYDAKLYRYSVEVASIEKVR